MNILPKKRWHVRTRDNINRVRRDEAKAAEEEKEKERRIKLAEREARTRLLRDRAREKLTDEQRAELEQLDKEALEVKSSKTHVNLFEDLEAGETTSAANAEHEAEKKKEQEEWEKKVGVLTYLGQDTEELTGERSWWQKLSSKTGEEETVEISEKSKLDSKKKELLDPLNDIRRYLGTSGVRSVTEKKRKRSPSPEKSKKKKKKSDKKKKKKKKKHRKHKHSDTEEESEVDEEAEKEKKRKLIEKLRAERLEREKKERIRAARLLNGEDPDAPEEKKKPEGVEKKQKYHTQFNPDFARQNKLDPKKKYWLE